jgi:subtilase family serine protease
VTGVIPTQSGRIEVTARLIPSGAATGDNSANNTLTRTLDLPEVRPDFTIIDLSLMPDNRIQVTIRNSGGYAPRDARGTVEVYADNDRVVSFELREWPNPRETKMITTTHPIVGSRNVRATVNPDRTVLEFNYENNTLTKKLTAHILKPDPIVRNIRYWKKEDSLLSPEILVIVIANIGKGTTSRTIKAEVFFGDRLIATPTLEGPIAKVGGKNTLTPTYKSTVVTHIE